MATTDVTVPLAVMATLLEAARNDLDAPSWPSEVEYREALQSAIETADRLCAAAATGEQGDANPDSDGDTNTPGDDLPMTTDRPTEAGLYVSRFNKDDPIRPSVVWRSPCTLDLVFLLPLVGMGRVDTARPDREWAGPFPRFDMLPKFGY